MNGITADIGGVSHRYEDTGATEVGHFFGRLRTGDERRTWRESLIGGGGTGYGLLYKVNEDRGQENAHTVEVKRVFSTTVKYPLCCYVCFVTNTKMLL